MTVYCVFFNGTSYSEDIGIVGVFDSEKLAEQAIRENAEYNRATKPNAYLSKEDNYSIVEKELNINIPYTGF